MFFLRGGLRMWFIGFRRGGEVLVVVVGIRRWSSLNPHMPAERGQLRADE